MSHKRDFWTKIIGEDWYVHLQDTLDSPDMEKLMKFLMMEYRSFLVYPAKENIFRAFRLTPYSDIKVVILGQDPYFDGSATGLAFANTLDTNNISPSLYKIKDCVERECYDGMLLDFDYTLEKWAEQGVLLLNTSLTVKKFMPASHIPIWKGFINRVIKSINKRNGLHFCLWGTHAKSYSPMIDPKRHFIYEEVHPAYASRNNNDWKCTHFNDINKNIIEQNGTEEIIIW